MVARILVIEDNPVNRDLVVYILRACGHEPLCAADGESGLAMARAELPDLVLCDIQMPGLDGLEVARRLRADPATCGLRLVAVSALAMAGDVQRSLDAGFDAHCSKPLEVQPFMALVAQHLGRQRAPTPRPPPPGPAVPTLREVPPALCAPRRPCTLLLVDDRPLNLDFKRHVFEAAGYTLHEAGSLAEALQSLDHLRPDLLLSDMHLADGSGLDLLARWRALPWRSGRPFVFLSSTFTGEDHRRDALAAGASAYLERPIEPLQLLGEIRALL